MNRAMEAQRSRRRRTISVLMSAIGLALLIYGIGPYVDRVASWRNRPATVAGALLLMSGVVGYKAAARR